MGGEPMALNDRKNETEMSAERGSALLLAIFAIALLTSVGVSLLFVAQQHTKAGVVSNRVKATFYDAESAIQDGREQLRLWNIASGTVLLSDELARAAGPNNVIDFDPSAVTPIYDSNGVLTGFTGVGDDEPVRPMVTDADGGIRVAYVTNDPAEGRTNLTDTNLKLVVTGIAVGPDQAFEMAENIVEHVDPLPPFASTITILGQNPVFEGGSSSAKLLTGNNCNQPVPPAYAVPVVGVQGPTAESQAEAGVIKPLTYVEGAETGVDTVDDINGTLDPRWGDCSYLRELGLQIKSLAHVVGDATTPQSAFGTPGDPKIVFIEGDYDLNGNFDGAGIIWVTGEFRFKGTVSWDGIVFAVGEGKFDRYGSGNGDITGGAIVANISGPDEILFTADDCAGPDGISGSADDGLGENATWDVSGGGTGDTIYCDTLVDTFRTHWPFRPRDFRQH